ncbi:hypothetical protein LDJ79_08480 [Vibrio tritonius]|uniref:Toxin co-regulated pilus biosynthesis protein Q C-terminal domain-containing protein n=1 Tax=Vibrio tritonius TaxID=1435069 RepID=A0ABS7YNZ7_9VIBR|nr:hypothetical protein [Vibrio tritonius]MCA2016144.1 hypothetical protein [Vibrio tritonius]
MMCKSNTTKISHFAKAMLLTMLVAPNIVRASSVSTEVHTQQNEKSEKYIQQLDGYTEVVVDTSFEQKNPLQRIVSLALPPAVKTVGEAINFVLDKSGYTLQSLQQTQYPVLNLYTTQVPLVNRKFIRTNLMQIITALIGKNFHFEVDNTLRVITIKGDK